MIEFTNQSQITKSLHRAIINGETDNAIALIQNGANIEAVYTRCTALHQAIYHRRTVIAIALIQNGANLETLYNGMTALHQAIIFGGQTDIAIALINKGANIEALYNGMTPLDWATERSQTAIAIALIQNGASIWTLDGNGKNCIDVAISKLNNYYLSASAIEILKAILSTQPDLSIVNGSHIRAWDAIKNNQLAKQALENFKQEHMNLVKSAFYLMKGEHQQNGIPALPNEIIRKIIKLSFPNYYAASDEILNKQLNKIMDAAWKIYCKRHQNDAKKRHPEGDNNDRPSKRRKNTEHSEWTPDYETRKRKREILEDELPVAKRTRKAHGGT